MPTPVRDLARRAPEQGRIRTGTSTTAISKNGKPYDRPEKLQCFRFTSQDEVAIRAIAGLYGGEPEPWDNAKVVGKQWKVDTPLARIEITLPPNALGDGVQYELWDGGVCLRRCDGVNAMMPVDGPDGMTMEPVACPCNASGKTVCKGKLRLNVILQSIPFGGTWRLETTSEHALREMPGMVDMIYALQDKDATFTSAVLVLEQRQTRRQVKGKTVTNNYGVPMLALSASLDEVMTGAKSLSAAANAQAPALGQSAAALDAGDGEPVEAEVLMDLEDITTCETLVTPIVERYNAANPEGPLSDRQVLQAFAAMISGDPQQSVSQLNDAEGERLLAILGKITRGESIFHGLKAGRVVVTRGMKVDVHELPARLRAERIKRGQSVREAAVLIGVSYPDVSRFENGKSNPTYQTILKYIDYLEAT